MRFTLKSLLLLIFTFPLYAQERNETATLLKNAEEMLFSDPEQSVRIGEHIIKNTTTEYEMGLAALFASKSYHIQGDYIKAVEYFNTANLLLKNTQNKELYIQSLLHTADMYSQLDLTEIKNENLSIANAIVENNIAFQELLHDYYLLADSTNSFSSLVKNISFENELKYPFAQIDEGSLQTRLANSSLASGHYDDALKYYTQALINIRKTSNNEYWEMKALLCFSDYFFNKKEYQKAIDTLNKALETGIKFKNPHFLNSAYSKLSATYLALDNNEQYQHFSQKTNIVAADMEIQKTRAINSVFNILQNEQNNVVLNAEKNQKINLHV